MDVSPPPIEYHQSHVYGRMPLAWPVAIGVVGIVAIVSCALVGGAFGARLLGRFRKAICFSLLTLALGAVSGLLWSAVATARAQTPAVRTIDCVLASSLVCNK